jgi:hypothetical protein
MHGRVGAAVMGFSGQIGRSLNKKFPGHLSGRLTVTVLAIAMAGAVAIPVSAQPVSKPARHQLCRQYAHVTVKARSGPAFVVRNFRVSKSGRNTIQGRVMSFPYILRGCSWGVCSPQAKLPARVRKLRKPEASWRAKTNARGRWNASLELWFAKHNMRNGQANRAELMIWLDTRNLPKSSFRVVRLDHTRWYLAHWVASGQGKTWNYIQFRRVHPVRGVNHLKLWPFIQEAEHLGWVKPTDWMLNIEAGFEVWTGGKGLGTKSFWAQP